MRSPDGDPAIRSSGARSARLGVRRDVLDAVVRAWDCAACGLYIRRVLCFVFPQLEYSLAEVCLRFFLPRVVLRLTYV
jgi:hypothetical protein